MLLAIDIGNTNIVAGVFEGKVLRAAWRLATDARKMPDEYKVLLQALFNAAGLSPSVITGSIMCGVVPGAQSMMRDGVQGLLGRAPLLVSSALDLGIEVRYSPPHGVGADRIANAVAAVDGYGSPAIVVDFGTSTNFDVISDDGAYVGGAIAPGLEISEEALFAHTAQLPRVPLEPPAAAIGTNTVASLQSGILFGYAGLIDGLVGRIQRELRAPAVVIATGGLSRTVAPCTECVHHVDLDLTLTGLRILYGRNTGAL